MKLATIQRYHELGFNIHPLCPPDHWCKGRGKVPYDPSTGHHMLDWATHEPFHMDIWDEWLDLEPNINIGMLCGSSSSIVGIDVDDEGGEAILKEMEVEPTWEYTTGRGRRLLFRHEKPLSSVTLVSGDQRLEILADGKNNVLPPSVHPSGCAYAWAPGRTPKEMQEPAELPGWAMGGILAGPPDTSDVTSDDIDWIEVCKRELQEGNRNNTMTRLAGWLLNSAPHTKNEAYFILRLINQRFGDPPLSDAELKTVVRSIDKREQKSEQALRARAFEIRKTHTTISFNAAYKMAREEE